RTDELHLGIVDDCEAIPVSFPDRPPARGPKARLLLLAWPEAGAGVMKAYPPGVTAIGLVEHVSGAGLDRDLLSRRHVIYRRWRDRQTARMIRAGIVDDVQLEAAGAAIPVRPGDQLIQRDRRRIDQSQHLRAFPPQRPVGKSRKPLEGLGEDLNRTPCIGIRQRRARQLADAQMVVVMRIGVP